MNSNNDVAYMKNKALEYKQELLPLLRYMMYFMERTGEDPSTNYDGTENGNNTLSFPIFDATLLSFVKEASQTSFMDKNYSYIYSWHHIRSAEDERKLIEKATITEWNVLCGILTHYVQGGMSRAYLWRDGVKENIFYLILSKMKEIVEYWDQPIIL